MSRVFVVFAMSERPTTPPSGGKQRGRSALLLWCQKTVRYLFFFFFFFFFFFLFFCAFAVHDSMCLPFLNTPPPFTPIFFSFSTIFSDDPYNLEVTDFGESWRDGLALAALLAANTSPEEINYEGGFAMAVVGFFFACLLDSTKRGRILYRTRSRMVHRASASVMPPSRPPFIPTSAYLLFPRVPPCP